MFAQLEFSYTIVNKLCILELSVPEYRLHAYHQLMPCKGNDYFQFLLHALYLPLSL